jgi:hypothetical protein
MLCQSTHYQVLVHDAMFSRYSLYNYRALQPSLSSIYITPTERNSSLIFVWVKINYTSSLDASVGGKLGRRVTTTWWYEQDNDLGECDSEHLEPIFPWNPLRNTKWLNKYHNECWNQERNNFMLPAVQQTTVCSTKHLPCYTPLPVDICTRSWKAIEVMAVAALEWATAFKLAEYSRTPRIRRGPSKDNCTTSKIWSKP